MKVLHVVPTYLPATRYGGTIRSVHGLCSGLTALGHTVEVFTTNIDGDGVSAVPLDTAALIEGVTVRYFSVPWMRRLYWSPGMARALSRRVREFDLVHLHSVFLWPTLAAARRAEGSRVPYIVSPRGMLVPGLIRRKGSLRKRAWIALFERRTLSRAASVHLTSSLEMEDYRAMGLPAERVLVIPNGVERTTPPSERSVTEFMRRQGLSGPYILYLGRISWKKGLDRLVDALAAVPGVDLVLAGNDEEGYRARIEERARGLGVENRLKWAGEVSGPEKGAAFAGAAMSVLPSYSENFGNTVLESMEAGCPAVVTPEVGAAEWVSRYDAGRVVSGDPAALGRCISEMLSDPEGRQRMGRNGRRAASEHFTWRSVAMSMAAAYERIVEEEMRRA